MDHTFDDARRAYEELRAYAAHLSFGRPYEERIAIRETVMHHVGTLEEMFPNLSFELLDVNSDYSLSESVLHFVNEEDCR